jgi:hypothetical protein
MPGFHAARWSTGSAVVAFALLTLAPIPASAEPGPALTSRRGFRLFAKAAQLLSANRVGCAIVSSGNFGSICRQGLFYSNSPGGVWPRGTIDQYLFASGPQAAGIVGIADSMHPWAGDTAGTHDFEEEVRPIYNWADPADAADWPLMARVPIGGPDTALYQRLLHGRPAASQGDLWWMSWEGNPQLQGAFLLGRTHPLGLAIEYRALTWNYPRGNEDIIYLVMTLYNITSLDPAAYLSARPDIRNVLLEQAQRFHRLNSSRFAISFPADGWEIQDLYVSYFVDPDVANAGENYASVNLPYSMGFAWQHDFSRPAGWTFDPSIFSPPFFPGVGFFGAKYLKSPTDPLTGADVGIRLFTTYTYSIQGAVSDPFNPQQLYRMMKGTLDPALGDGQCNSGNPLLTRLCYINNVAPGDMRLFQSSGPLQLKAGGQASIVMALIFAAPVHTPTCAVSCSIRPGDPTVLLDPATAANANPVDTLTGFRRYLGDLDGDGQVDQEEIDAIPGSLLGKAKLAQAVFDNQFLLPFAPEPPDFFLIPGDNQVTVIWKPSPSETEPDPFFEIASNPSIGGVPNPLYDPNYRKFDVEGYRIYRGRVDAPNEMALVAQFDYRGTVISDYTGTVNAPESCAPEYGILSGCAGPVAPNLKDGTPLTGHVDYELAGEVVQIRAGSGRTPLAGGTKVLVLAADTVSSGGGTAGTCGPRSVCPQLENTGVPFAYVDREVRNHFRYYYSVTAFDVNSIESGPPSIESARARSTSAVTPARPASNVRNTAQLSMSLIGGGRELDSAGEIPTIDRSTGRFSGPFPPANGATLGFAGGLVSEVIGTGLDSLQVVLDSIRMGSANLQTGKCCQNGQPGAPTIYYWSATSGGATATFSVPMEVDPVSGSAAATPFPSIPLDKAAVARYGGSGSYQLQGEMSLQAPSLGYLGEPMLAAVLDYPGFTAGDLSALGATGARYNGARWFNGPSPARNETTPNPINACGLGRTGECAVAGTFENAGKLTGVVTAYQPLAYTMYNRAWRNFSAVVAGVRRAADYNLYWGANGVIDRVIDITHNVPVPFQDSVVSGGWGVLNTTATGPGSHDGRGAVLTPSDWYCVEPFNTVLPGVDAWFPCDDASRFILDSVAVPGAIAFGAGDNNTAVPGVQDVRNPSNLAANPGFSLYLAGTVTFFELAGGQVPQSGTVWTLRDYTGLIAGGNGIGGSGDLGPYSFVPQTRPFTAIGAGVLLRFAVVNQLRASRVSDLRRVHTVPDPYYVTSAYEVTTEVKVIKFVNLPQRAIIRIYSASGVLVNVLEHDSPSWGSEESWNVQNRNGMVVASGVYFYHIEAGDARRVGRFTVVNWAQ